MTVLKSPLFIAVLCLLTNDTHSLTDCKFDSYCQPYGSDWWKYHSSVCYQCPSGKKYHCARDYDSKEFKEDCAEEKFCPEGEEPNLSYWKNGQEITEPIVYCEPCHDKERFNSQQNTSSAEYSECPDPKWNKCTEDRHKILCKPDDSTEDRYCRCDARKGFSPVNDFSYEKCSYKDYDCRDYRKCDSKEDLLLNYTCAAKCPDGFGRLDEDTDDCKLIPTVKTESIILSSLKTTNSNSTTLPSTFSPESTEKPSQGCVEECHEYKICVDGKCVCPDNCTSVREPVCGHHAGSESEYKTFPSICELKRRYCTDKKYIFHSNGECSKEDSKLQVQWIILVVCIFLLGIFVFLIIIFKTKNRRQRRNRYFPPQENRRQRRDRYFPPQEIITNSSVDGDQRNTMPLDEVPSSNNRSGPKGSQRNSKNISIKNVYKYYAPVVHTEGGETHLSMTNGSENIAVKYNKDQIEDGEGDSLLTGEDDTISVQEPINVNRSGQSENGSSLNSTASVEEILEKKNTDAYVNVETDSDELPTTEKDHSNLGRTYKRQRQNSMSYESLFLKPNITDIEEVTNGKSECKEVINKVMDKSITYLVENMDSKAVIDRFTAKEILTHNKRRDILDLVKQSDQSREIIKSVRETGNYQALKTALADSKQLYCLEKLEQIQNEVVKDLQKKQNLEKPEEQQSSQQKKGPCFVPPEETFEERAYNILKNLMKIHDGKKNDDTENAFEAFTNSCEDITQQFPDLKFEDIVKDCKLPESLPVQEEYRNTPEGFQAYKSSGEDNSCLYQSISLLLTGTEDSQCCLRLMGTLHAVREYSTYKKQLQRLDPEQRKLFFYTQSRQIQDVDDSEDIIDKFLKTLIMETACVGTDSSVLHVAFLSGALGLNIHQYFQHYEDNGAKLVEMLKDINIPGCFLKPDLPELHVFWVNMKNEENGIINHFVPLLPKKETTEEKS